MLLLICGLLAWGDPAGKTQGGLPNPILFVTQVPIPADFTTIGSTFGNHQPEMEPVGRGGDLYILYPNGTLKNLTQLAGYGMTGHQGPQAIAVRDPAVHWDGQKAIFSMVIGAPPQFQYLDYYWQLYEVTGLGINDTPVITKVPNQPEFYNNIQPCYASDDRIIFCSDRPRAGMDHLHPLRDEYEEAPTVTGIWSLNPTNGDLFQINHTPSGAFTPFVDSFGRVLFTRWDHLQRDQQADADELSTTGTIYGTFNYSDESAAAAIIDSREEFFPEPRAERTDLLAGTNLEGHSFNLFFPWQINQDGTEEETLNHIGRHELSNYFNRSINDDPNVTEFIASVSGRFNGNEVDNFFQLAEDPNVAGRIIGIDAPEFQTHAAGQVIIINGQPANADTMSVTYITHRDTSDPTPTGQTPSANHSGLYRDPIILSDGTILAVHTSETHPDQNAGTGANPQSLYDFRIKLLNPSGLYYVGGTSLTGGISKSLSYFDPDQLVSYNGPLWELNPVEVMVRPRPSVPMHPLSAPEAQIFSEEGVDVATFKQWMAERDLALAVSRDVTTRDSHDEQQPYNLFVQGGTASTAGAGGTMYPIKFMQFFQADHLRGIGGIDTPRPGRRVLAQPMHDPAVDNPPSTGPEGSVTLGDDGSMAAFVPARRAMSWQLTEPDGTPVVRERFWVNFQPGEVRVCASCHGINTSDQASQSPPVNPPEALRTLLQYWKSLSCAPGSEDVNTDGRINVLDGCQIASAVGQINPALDFNCDGQVTAFDVQYAMSLWLQP